jgi:hypothetical protein
MTPDTQRWTAWLREVWAGDDREFFDGRLPHVPIRLGRPEPGDYPTASYYWGTTRDVVIHEDVVNGLHPETRGLSELGVARYGRDLLLHEAVHAFLEATGGEPGHGNDFLRVCQRITRQLGCKKRTALLRLDLSQGNDFTCRAWPMSIRRKRFYERSNR